jgi:hypothetical protein
MGSDFHTVWISSFTPFRRTFWYCLRYPIRPYSWFVIGQSLYGSHFLDSSAILLFLATHLVRNLKVPITFYLNALFICTRYLFCSYTCSSFVLHLFRCLEHRRSNGKMVHVRLLQFGSDSKGNSRIIFSLSSLRIAI